MTAIDGKPIRTPGRPAPHDPCVRQRTGDLHLKAKRSSQTIDVTVRPERGPEGRPVIGVIVSQAATIKLPRDVEIDSGGVGGPSAGLAFALDLVEELGTRRRPRQPRRGHRRARARRSRRADRRASSRRRSACDGQGSSTSSSRLGKTRARRAATREDVRVIPVSTFQQALRQLATLPSAAQD